MLYLHYNAIIVITIYYTIGCCLLCQSWWHFSPLIGVVTCSHEHLCVVAVPTTSCFQYVCHLSYFYSIRGIATCCGDNVCTVSHAYPAAFLIFCVMCLYLHYFNNCYHYLLHHWLLPIMPVLVDFLLLLEFFCAVMNTCVLSQRQPQVVFPCLPFITYLAA